MKEFLRFSLLAILLAPFAWADQNSTLIEKITAGDASGGDHFGSAVSQWGNFLAVGAKDADTTHVYWVEDNGSLIELAKLTPPDGGSNSKFGWSVALADGVLAVGAKWSDQGGHSDSGAAYLYQVEQNGTVHYLQKVTAPDANATDNFGFSVSVSGNLVAVGSPEDDHGGLSNAGSAYLYRLEENGTISHLGKVTASDASDGDVLGLSVSLSGDLLAVGAPQHEHGGGGWKGSAYLYRVEQNGSVSELGMVTAPDSAVNDYFGYVSLSGDMLAVGALMHDANGLSNSGAAYLYRSEQNGSISYLDKIKDAPAGAKLGLSLSLEGDLLAIGAHTETHGGKSDAGAAYLYRVEHNGSATLLDRIVAHDANVSDEFGYAVSLSDGVLAVGAHNADHGGDTDPGAVYLFDVWAATNRAPVDIRPDPFLGFSPEKEELIHNLQTGWLKATEELVFNAYGLTVYAGDDWNVTVHEHGDEPSPVHFAYDVDQNGQIVVNSLEFHLPALQPYLDASMGKFLLAREMCRMLMTKNSYYGDITGDGVSSGDWFKLGLMDFLVGADDRVLDILGAEPTDSEIDALLAEVGDGEMTVTNQQIAAAYLAVRYLDFKLKGAGKTGGVKHMTQWIKTQYENGAGAADSGINAYVYYQSGGFSLTEFKGTAGRDFVKNHVLPKLDNDDTGSVLGGDVTGGASLDRHGVVPDVHGPPQSNVLYEIDEWANVMEFEEGSPVGTVVGRFNAIDPDDPQIGWKGYELIDHGANLTWTQANAAADAADAADPFHWIYLATVTSEAEHNLTAHLVAQSGLQAWLGGSDSAVEGEWRWTEGPEGQEDGGQGLQFWQGLANGNSVNGLYANWGNAEPNNLGGLENWLKLRPDSNWNDNPDNGLNVVSSYILEFDQVLTHVYSLVSGEGDENNDMFVLDPAGTLRTEYTLDYENDATYYSIRVRATDELNASFEKIFWVDLLDVNEDPDGDGLHNDVDLDDDGDGYPDTEEDSANSDPRNAWSLPPVTKIIYVDLDADGEKNGSSWASAYDNLQAALAEADGVNRTQIWVAEGVYRPDVGPGQTEGERNSTFQLKNRLEIIGGFQGDEQTFEEREMHGFNTYLSGDVGAHNWPDDNVYHVVTSSGVDRTAILLDLGIGRGQADGPTEWDKRGAGMLADNGSPSLQNLLFFDNHATAGSNSGGGGLCVYNGGSPAVFSCVFEANSAEWGGAVKLSAGSSAIFYNALMLRNQAGNGGAMVVWESNVSITHSTIIDNNASNGGALYLGNEANASVVNSIVWANNATSDPNLRKDAQSNLYPDHSIIQGSLGDLPDGDPLFVDPVFNDLRLRLGSPAIDAGNPAQVGALPVGYGGVNRTHDAGPDLGAYEGAVDAVNLGGLVSYSGLIDTGPYRVWLMDESGNRIKEVEMEEPDSFSFVVQRGRSYDVKAFRDANGDGWPNQDDPWAHHHNEPILVEGSRNDFDVPLEDRDSDEDGFLDMHEVDANTDPFDPNSHPGLEYGLVAYFPFDGNASDMSGNAISSTMDGYGQSDTKWVNGPFGQGLFFDGANDTVLLGNGGILDDIQPLSVSAWVKRIGLGYILSKRTESTGYWRLGLDANNFGWFRDFSGSGHVSAQAPTFAAEEWRLITLTWDGDTNGSGARIYVDDQEVTTQRGDADGNFLSDSANILHIGSKGGTGEFFHGVIDELRIWDRVILPQEVQEIFNPELEDGLVAHWTFDETEGSILHDSSGNDVHGTMHGFTEPWSAGRVGGALYFDGVDDYVSFPGATQLDDLQPFSFAGWIKLDQEGSGYVLAKRSETTGYWRLFSSSTTHSWLVRKTTGTLPALSADATTPFLEWRHLAMSWDGSLAGDGMKFYLDGEEVGGAQKTPGTGELVSDANNLFTIGNRPQGNSSYFKGWLDDFHIWNRVISPEEVDAVANPILPDENATVSGTVHYEGPVPGPVIVWVFDDEGQLIRDLVLPNGSGAYSVTLPKGEAYDVKAFRDGNENGQLDASWQVGEPYAHHGDWNSSTDSFNTVFVDENLSGVDVVITWHGDHDGDGFTDWEEYVAETAGDDNQSFPVDDENATVSGTVFYEGPVPGPVIVWVFDDEGQLIRDLVLPNGSGAYSVTLPKGEAYDVKAFRDGNENGQLDASWQVGEPYAHHGDWNSSAGGFNTVFVGENLSGVDVVITWHGDHDGDGFTDWEEYVAETAGDDNQSFPEVDDGLVAHWTFDETEGTVLNDSSGNDVHGTMNGFTEPWSEGKLGGALYFDGVDDYVSFPGATQLDDLQPFSFAGWIKLDQGGDGYVLAKRSETTGYWRLFSSSTTQSWLVRKTTGTPPILSVDATTPFLEWRHLAMSWDGSLAGDGMKFYLDGEEVEGAQKTPGTGELVSDANNLFTIGNRPQGNHSYFKGWMDDFRIYGRVLSAVEIAQFHEFGSYPPGSNEGPETHPHEEAFVPIVRTYHHEEESNGVCWFGGQVLTDGGSPVLEAGVLVSRSIFFEDAIRLPGEMDPENNQFLVITDDLEKGARYYYRAYARNAVGENVGSIKKFVTQEEVHPDAWWSDMPEGGGGWRVSDWFGEFRNFEQTDWIYHAKLGWVFVVPDEERGLWLWHRELGWLWTQEGVWPHLWRNEVSAWIYFLRNHEGRPVIYNYGTSDYLILP